MTINADTFFSNIPQNGAPLKNPAYLEDGAQSGEHVLELLFFLVGEGSDHGLELSGLEIGHLEHILEKQLGVNQAGPGEQVNQTGN